MKSRTLLIILTGCSLYFSSCSKTRLSDIPKGPIATSRFLLNNSIFQWNGFGGEAESCLYCGPKIYNHTTYFTIATTDDVFGELVFKINTATLERKTYTDTTTIPISDSVALNYFNLLGPSYVTVHAASIQPGDYASITITSIKEGKYYDGTFHALLTSYPLGLESYKAKIIGEFHNATIDAGF
ncbi:MAG: hypothetical protein C5B59_13470 [Bacteroidetes bacterium]|nr:MAG: hypothetical protein C5B59_13470 [Bacteroidota bacterium]